MRLYKPYATPCAFLPIICRCGNIWRKRWRRWAGSTGPSKNIGVGILFFGGHLPRSMWEDALAAAKFLCVAYFWGAAISTWLVNLLPFARLKR